MTKFVVESPGCKVGRLDPTNGHACAAGTNQLDTVCASAARAEERVVRRIVYHPTGPIRRRCVMSNPWRGSPSSEHSRVFGCAGEGFEI